MQIWIKNIELENIHIPVQARHQNALQMVMICMILEMSENTRKVICHQEVLQYIVYGGSYLGSRKFHDDPAIGFGDAYGDQSYSTFPLKDQQTEFLRRLDFVVL